MQSELPSKRRMGTRLPSGEGGARFSRGRVGGGWGLGSPGGRGRMGTRLPRREGEDED